jgi:hypothetical protein
MSLNDSCPTVQIEDGKGGFVVINECDFDAKKHKKHGVKTRKPRAKKTEETQD